MRPPHRTLFAMTGSRVVAAVLALLQAVSVKALCEDFFCYETVTTSGTCESATNGRCTTLSSADCEIVSPHAICTASYTPEEKSNWCAKVDAKLRCCYWEIGGDVCNICKCPGTRTKTPTKPPAPASSGSCEGGDACKETACSGCYKYCDVSGNYGQLSQGKGMCTSQVPATVWYLDCNGCDRGGSLSHGGGGISS